MVRAHEHFAGNLHQVGEFMLDFKSCKMWVWQSCSHLSRKTSRARASVPFVQENKKWLEPQPSKTQHQLLLFLGMCGYYPGFCKLGIVGCSFDWFVKSCQPLFVDLWMSGVIWLTQCSAVQHSSAVCFSFQAGSGCKFLWCRCCTSPGGWYFSKKFNKQQKNCRTNEKETLALHLAVQHFKECVSSSFTKLLFIVNAIPWCSCLTCVITIRVSCSGPYCCNILTLILLWEMCYAM